MRNGIVRFFLLEQKRSKMTRLTVRHRPPPKHSTSLTRVACVACVTWCLTASSLPTNSSVLLRFFGDSRPWVATVTAGIRVWLDGVGEAGMYRTAERMNGRTRLHRCREGIPVNKSTRIQGLLVRIGSREQDTKCVAISWTSGLGRTMNRWGGYTSQTVKTLVHEW